MTCAALVAHHLGRDYWAWTPHQLYRALRRESETVEISRAGSTTGGAVRESLDSSLRRLACKRCSGAQQVLGCPTGTTN